MKNLDKLHAHMLQCFPLEGCGYVDKDDNFIACENVAANPIDNFALSKHDSYVVTVNKYKVIHSHTFVQTDFDARTPSYEDMITQQNVGTEFGIVHTDGTSVSYILWFGKPKDEPLEGRFYISNVYDCFTLARDFLVKEFGYDVGTHPRPADWFNWNPNYIEETWKQLRFTQVQNLSKLQFGDILFFNIGERKINHIGVYLQNDIFVHHLHKRLSCTDSLTKYNKQLNMALRYG